jgi:hypothetical protein
MTTNPWAFPSSLQARAYVLPVVDECVPLQYLLHGAGDGPVPMSQARPCSKHGGAKGQAAKQEVWK